MEHTAHDKAVLEFLFNPRIQSPQQAAAGGAAPATAAAEEAERDLEGVEEGLVREVKAREAAAVALAEAGRLQEAEEALDALVARLPAAASLYSNRAEVRRLQKRYADAVADAERALARSHPAAGDVRNARVAREAHALRGFLLKGLARREGDDGSADLEAAAALGHSLARLETNPYRTLCSDMVEVMMEQQCGIPRRP